MRTPTGLPHPETQLDNAVSQGAIYPLSFTLDNRGRKTSTGQSVRKDRTTPHTTCPDTVVLADRRRLGFQADALSDRCFESAAESICQADRHN